MFYSHEILTSRQYGVATIWLVATLGSKSNLKKVTRKAILDVNVAKACDTITDPGAPMALRLQGSLLYGVSRVYSQQCGYFLSDMQSFRDKMREVMVLMKDVEIDPEISKTRPEQLNLSEDPTFNPDFDMGLDLSLFDDLDTASANSSLLSPHASASSRSSIANDIDQPALELPSYSTPGFGGFDFKAGDAGTSSAPKTGSAANLPFFEESALVEDPGFEFDGDGNLILHDHDATGVVVDDRTMPATGALNDRIESETGLSARAAAAIQPDKLTTQGQAPGFNDDLLMFDDDVPILQDADVFLPHENDGERVVENANQSSLDPPPESGSTIIQVPQRRAKPIKPLHFDRKTEVLNRQLAAWSENYADIMDRATMAKRSNKSIAQARRSASFWILEQGVGAVANNFAADRDIHPLAMFSGQTLLDSLMGEKSENQKRTHNDSSEDEDDDQRRVRPRTDDEEAGFAQAADDDGIFGIMDDDVMNLQDDRIIESEIGRRAPPSLQDRSSFPWNVSASRQGSQHPFGSIVGGFSSSVGRPSGGVAFGPPNISRRGSRLTSASPLHGKGQSVARASSLLLLHESANASTFGDDLGDAGLTLPADDEIATDDFELFGPSAVVDTQTAEHSQWLAATLENESYNFLTFLENFMRTKASITHQNEDGAERDTATVTFEQLLPPNENTKMVAAQGLLHVLGLATKSLINVQQEEAYAQIEMRVMQPRA